MTQVTNKSSCRVLVFSPLKKLIAIFQSVTATAKAFGVSPTSIHLACTGVTISCCNLYFRHLSDDMEIESNDFGTLRIEEYDKMCGVERKYYPTKVMSRAGMKYKSKIKDNGN